MPIIANIFQNFFRCLNLNLEVFCSFLYIYSMRRLKAYYTKIFMKTLLCLDIVWHYILLHSLTHTYLLVHKNDRKVFYFSLFLFYFVWVKYTSILVLQMEFIFDFRYSNIDIKPRFNSYVWRISVFLTERIYEMI